MTAAGCVSADELAQRERVAAEAERTAFAAWERAYGAYETAATEHVRALMRDSRR